MSSKEQKTPGGQARKKLSWISTKKLRAVESDASAEQVDPRDEKLRIWKLSLLKPKLRERDSVLRIKAEMENLRRRTELDVEKRISLHWKNSSTNCCRCWIARTVRWKLRTKIMTRWRLWLKVIES